MGVYLICLGSNYHKKENFLFARTQLNKHFPSIEYGDELETEPLDISNPACFLNQVARFTTSSDIEEVSAIIKQLEKTAGRTPESKITGEIPLDIDILMYNDTTLKPADMGRDYVIKGIKTLHSKADKRDE